MDCDNEQQDVVQKQLLYQPEPVSNIDCVQTEVGTPTNKAHEVSTLTIKHPQ